MNVDQNIKFSRYRDICSSYCRIHTFFYSYSVGQLLWGIIAAGMIILIAGILFFLPLITDPLNSSGYRGNEKSESFGVESTCLGDSIVYERPFFFIGVPFIIIALGGIFSKHESIFSIAYENGTTLVLYPGVCFVSKDDKISIRGKWHRGKKSSEYMEMSLLQTGLKI